jgi:hypothetical protein
VDSLASHAAHHAAPKILEHLVAAGLASHELIGDPARLESETAALAALCARISGPVYRLGAFHYAFRMAPEDLGGSLADREPADWAGALEAALTEDLGAEAVWVTGTDPVTDAGLDAASVMFLEAADGAVGAALAEAPGLRAVIHARIATQTAETAAALAAQTIAARLAGIEASVEAAAQASLDAAIEAAVEVAAEAAAQRAAAAIASASETMLERIATTLGALADRLQLQGTQLADQSARQDALASGIAALEAAMAGLATTETVRAAALDGFEDRLGLTLAEFLAQLAPQATPHAPRPAPQPASRIASRGSSVAPSSGSGTRVVETGRDLNRDPGAGSRGVAALQLG